MHTVACVAVRISGGVVVIALCIITPSLWLFSQTARAIGKEGVRWKVRRRIQRFPGSR